MPATAASQWSSPCPRALSLPTPPQPVMNLDMANTLWGSRKSAVVFKISHDIRYVPRRSMTFEHRGDCTFYLVYPRPLCPVYYISVFSVLAIHSRPFSSLLLTSVPSPPSRSRPPTLPELHVISPTLDRSENTHRATPVGIRCLDSPGRLSFSLHFFRLHVLNHQHVAYLPPPIGSILAGTS